MIQYSTGIRNAQLDQVESVTGTSAKLQFRTGTQPAACSDADSGTLLLEITLPSDWMSAAASGVKSKSGTWSGNATTAGLMGHFRIKDNAGTTTHIQGTVSVAGGGGDMVVDSISVTVSQLVTVGVFTLVRGNA